MLSDCKEAGLDLPCRSVPISMTADLGMIALTRQAEVMVIAGGSGAASLVELTTNWGRRFSKFRQSRCLPKTGGGDFLNSGKLDAGFLL